jgi:hypothetical protein
VHYNYLYKSCVIYVCQIVQAVTQLKSILFLSSNKMCCLRV